MGAEGGREEERKDDNLMLFDCFKVSWSVIAAR